MNMDLKVLVFSVLLCYKTVSAGDRRNYSPAAQQLLSSFRNMRGQMLSGLFGGYTGVTDDSKFNLNHAHQLKGQTGKFPLIYGLDCAHGWDPTTNGRQNDLINCYDQQAIDFATKWGGIISISHHLPNPFFDDNKDWEGKGAYKTKLNNQQYASIVGPARSPARDRWWHMMEKIADGLKAYMAHGIPVLYRPLHEMNGDWFWWGGEKGNLYDRTRKEQFKQLWIDLWRFMHNQKGLDNLIWVYSPDKSKDQTNAYYPGDLYVDMVSLDAYTEDPSSDGQIQSAYNEVTRINKPFGFGEIGPAVDEQGRVKRKIDYKKYVEVMLNKYPKTVYFMPWNTQWSPINNFGAREAYNNPRVRSLGDFKLPYKTY